MFWPGNWSFSGWSGPSTLQKRLVKFLLRRTVGQFMKHDSIDLDDLDVQLSEGCLRLRNVALNEDALTDMLSGAPVSITSGLIGEITFKVPWSQLWTGHCDISVDRVSVVAELLDPTNAPYAAHDIAESVQTDGATSILASSVFIADDFLRDESGSHPSDRGNATTLNRDVEQMVSNIYEERLRWKMANDASRRRQSVVGGGPPIPNRQDESGSPDVFTEPSPEEKDMTRLQLVSEMVDRILSGLNINVGKIDLQLRLPFDHKDNNPSSRSAYLNLEVGSIRYFDNPSGQSHLPAVDEFVPNDSDFSMEPRYRAIEFRTLHKRLLIDGVLLRYYPSSNGVDLGPSATPSDYCFTLFSTFDDVVTADIRIHRRQPFTEIAIVQRVFDVQGESGSIYMGSMPGEFRDSSSARPNNEWSPTDADSPSRVTPRATAADGRAEDKAPTSNGWDAQLRVKDVAFVLSSEHIDIVRRLGDLFQGFLSERAEKVELRSRYGASMPMHQQGPLGLSFETSANRRVFDLVLESFVFIVLAPPADSASDDELAATTHHYHHHHQDVWRGVHDSGTLKQQLASQKHLDLTLSDLAFNYEAFEPGRAAADFILSSGSRHYSLALDPDTPSLAPGRDGYQQQQRHRQDPDGPSLELSLSIGDIQFIDHDPCRNMPRAHVLVLGPALDKAALSCINVERSCHLYFRKRANDPTFEAHMAPLRIDLDLELADRMRVYDGLFSEPRDTQQSANVVKDDGPPVEAASKVPPRTFAHTFGSGAGQHHFQEGTHRSDAEPLYKVLQNARISGSSSVRSFTPFVLKTSLAKLWITLPGLADLEGGSAAGNRRHPPNHVCLNIHNMCLTNIVNGSSGSSQDTMEAFGCRSRTPRVQDLLGSRDNSFDAGFRIEYEYAEVLLPDKPGQAHSGEGSTGDTFISLATIGGRGSDEFTRSPSVLVSKPHIEFTTSPLSVGDDCGAAGGSHQLHQGDTGEASAGIPPAFDIFDYLDLDARVRRFPEMDAAVATEFEQNCIGRARLMLSCHFPKIDVRLSRNSMRRVRQILDEFFMWQANQSSDDLDPATDIKPLDSGSPALRIAVLLDISSALINVSERDDGPDVVPDAEQLALLFGDSRVFMSNAGISRGRTFVCFEAGRAELQRNDLADPELRTIFSSMAKMDPIANFTSPSIPQVGFYFLSAPSLKDISDAVVQLSWTSFSLKALLRCAKDFGKLLEFAVDEQPDLPPPPPRPMRVCLNARDSSIKYSPPEDGLPDTAIAVGTFIQMLHINMPEPEESNRSKRRDQEPNRYVFEDISVMAESPNALTSAPDHLDQWNSVRRFWENRKFVPLLYSDTFDITIRIEGSNEDQEDQNGGGGNSPFINLVFSCEKVVLEICADSRQSLMDIARSIGKSTSPSPTTLPMASDARRSPQVVHTGTDNILADIEEGVFGAANVGSSPQHRKQNLSPSTHSGSRRNSHASRLSSCSSGARGGGLTFVEDYISASIPDISSEYEVVANPTSPKLTSPSYKSLDPKRHTPHRGGLGSSPVQRRGDVVEEVPAEHRNNALDMIGPELGAPSLYSPNLEAHPFTSPKEATTSYYSPDNIVKVKPYGGDGGGSSSRGLDIIDDHFAAPDPQELRWGEQSRGQDRISRIAVIIENLLVHLYDGSDWERPDPRYGSGSSTITKSGVPMDRRGRSHLCDGWGAEDSEAMDRHVFSKSYPEDSSPMAEFFEYDEDGENDGDEDSVIVPRTIDYPRSGYSPHATSRQVLARGLLRGGGGGGGGRSATPQIIVQSRRVYAMLEMFSENSPIAFGTTIDLDTFEIIDNLESSEWHKFLTRLKGEDMEYGASPVQSSGSRGAKNADVPIFERATSYSPGKSGHVWPESRDESFIQLKVESIRPHPSLATTEVRMDIEIAPVRCYIDQDALEFLIGFFSAPQLARGSDMSGRQPPMDAASESMQLEPYFQAVHVAPLRVRFDYKPKRVDFGQVRGGNMVELLNLFPLEDADMSLSSAYIYGVKGVQRLAQRLKDHWLPHVTRTQMPRLVSGLAPLRAVSNLGSSASDLIFLPLQQYKKDGRIVKGIQRGAKSFAKSAALGMLDLGARVAVNAQTLLEQAGDILNVDIGSGNNNNNNDVTTIPVTGRITGYQHDSDEDFVDIEDEGWPNDVTIDLVDFPDTLSVRSSIPSVGNGRRADARKMPSSHNIGTNFLKSKYARQPLSANQGIRQAYQSLTRQFSEASQTILAIPIEIKQSSNRSGAVRSTTHSSVRAVVRAVPVAILKPAIGATEATSKALLGIRNSLDSRHRRQLEDKYKPRSAAGRDYR